MTKKYAYLKKYMSDHYDKIVPWPENVFYAVEQKEIDEAEAQLGFSFPSELKQFYQEIGEGRITAPERREEDYEFCNSNRILPPHAVANFTLGSIEWHGQEHWIAEDVVEDLEDGDLPFFEIGDSSRFLIMKANSENPNAVWSLSGIKIEDSFERFIWRLYYESPWFYDDIIEAHYANLENKNK